MKTNRILAIAFLCWASFANAQDKKDEQMQKLINSDVQNAKKDDEQRAKAATQKVGGETKSEPAKATQVQQAPPSDEEKAWMDYSTPGQVHKMLAAGVGEWNETVTFWMAPGAEPQRSTSKCTITMILGGRYQKSVTKGMMMGMPFEGIGTVGYDNMLGVYQSTWMDNMGTGTMLLIGKYDETTKTIDSRGKMPDPMQHKEVDVRQTVTFVSANEMKIEMFTMMGDKEFKTMEIVMKRVVKKK